MTILDNIARKIIEDQIKTAKESAEEITRYMLLEYNSQEKLSQHHRNALSAINFLVGLGYPPSTSDSLGSEVNNAILSTKRVLGLLDEFLPKLEFLRKQKEMNRALADLPSIDIIRANREELRAKLEERRRVIDQMYRTQEG